MLDTITSTTKQDFEPAGTSLKIISARLNNLKPKWRYLIFNNLLLLVYPLIRRIIMKKGNPQKKEVFQDNFIKHWCCSAENHPEGWAWWKRKVRKAFRRKQKKELEKEIKDFT